MGFTYAVCRHTPLPIQFVQPVRRSHRGQHKVAMLALALYKLLPYRGRVQTQSKLSLVDVLWIDGLSFGPFQPLAIPTASDTCF
jgi:hypothetical protein